MCLLPCTALLVFSTLLNSLFFSNAYTSCSLPSLPCPFLSKPPSSPSDPISSDSFLIPPQDLSYSCFMFPQHQGKSQLSGRCLSQGILHCIYICIFHTACQWQNVNLNPCDCEVLLFLSSLLKLLPWVLVSSFVFCGVQMDYCLGKFPMNSGMLCGVYCLYWYSFNLVVFILYFSSRSLFNAFLKILRPSFHTSYHGSDASHFFFSFQDGSYLAEFLLEKGYEVSDSVGQLMVGLLRHRGLMFPLLRPPDFPRKLITNQNLGKTVLLACDPASSLCSLSAGEHWWLSCSTHL